MVLLLSALTKDAAPAPKIVPVPPAMAVPVVRTSGGRCQNARVRQVQGRGEAVPANRRLTEEPLADLSRAIVRDASCDRPEIVAKRVGDTQR
ncbi:hypothetical protein [Sphingomonas elodea]|uniref:hypothetical protein n=1 Tax=Sphingomonas elodea TaxID=179878 RepID=UPI00111049E7|nr:hypothetical protein [Sphingomonas elodea]